MQRIVIFGAGPLFKGGIAHYTQSLATALAEMDDIEVHVVSWTAPYPSFIPHDFIDETPHKWVPGNVSVHYITNCNDVRSWRDTYKFISLLHPDLVIFEWSTVVQGLPIAYIARKLRRKTDIKLVFDLHYVKSVRHTTFAAYITRKTIGHAHHYIVHSLKAACELKEMFPATSFTLTENIVPLQDGSTKIILQIFHPVYDMFKPEKPVDTEALKKELHLSRYVFLFFGFISRYKGLHHVIDAFAELCKERDDVSLLIVGESSWQTAGARTKNKKLRSRLLSILKSMFLSEADDEGRYHPLDKIEALGLQDRVTLINHYVPDNEVAGYFAVSDYVMLYYEAANSAGIEAIADGFGVPVLCTRVGHFPETVEDGVNGYIAEVDNLTSMVETMRRALAHPIDRKNVLAAAQTLTWKRYAETVARLLPQERTIAPKAPKASDTPGADVASEGAAASTAAEHVPSATSFAAESPAAPTTALTDGLPVSPVTKTEKLGNQ
ncbi:MAG: glycosyltransferase [Bacteroidales bacterium]|nr:glycosyltransferase [Bacteroidales bacterium]